MGDKKLKVAVVGLTAGAGHVSNYAASDSVYEVLICDTDQYKLNKVGDKFGIEKRYTDYNKMLKEGKPDVVSVAVPNNMHKDFTLLALEANAHVLCEKPMARNYKEAYEMLKAAEKYNKKLMINFNRRFQKESVALKSVIDEGGLGDIYFARTVWQRRRGVPWWYPLEKGREATGGGAMIDLGVHMLDLAMWLCGYPNPQWVMGNTFNEVSRGEAAKRGIPDFDFEDMAVAMIRMTNGMMMELEASWAANRENEVITTRLYGTQGGAVISRVVDSDNIVEAKMFIEKDGVLEDYLIEDITDIPTIRQSFLDSIINDEKVPCTPEQGLLINKILDSVYESARTGKPVLCE